MKRPTSTREGNSRRRAQATWPLGALAVAALAGCLGAAQSPAVVSWNAPGVHFARPAPTRREPIRATLVVVGERWGCASFAGELGTSWQCWNAPTAPTGESPQAWTVSWLRGEVLRAGPDRICQMDRWAPAFRCWQPPAQGDAMAHELPAEWEWLDPNGAVPGDDKHADLAMFAFVGGTFACLRSYRGTVWCRGDNHFGQLLGSGWAESVALGTWHGCMVAPPRVEKPFVACWGRGDYGQLGAVAPGSCAVDGVTIPCAVSPVHGPPADGYPFEKVGLGDLFSCVSTRRGIQCWGANRDGFFGAPGSCPASLRASWPTLHGTVPAPQAACSPAPVDVPGVPAPANGSPPGFAVGPRGLCFVTSDGARCVGGVPSPRGGLAGGVVVSPGADASACALRDGGVVCWGDAYSPPGALDRPVSVAFETVVRGPAAGISPGGDPAGYSSGCLIRRGCVTSAPPLPRCAQTIEARELSQVLQAPDTLAGQVVSVRGRLGVGGTFVSDVGCSAPDGTACCNQSGGEVVLAGSPSLVLGGLACQGDDSLACCNAPAFGQTVVATGRLEREPGGFHMAAGLWRLAAPSLCSE